MCGLDGVAMSTGYREQGSGNRDWIKTGSASLTTHGDWRCSWLMTLCSESNWSTQYSGTSGASGLAKTNSSTQLGADPPKYSPHLSSFHGCPIKLSTLSRLVPSATCWKLFSILRYLKRGHRIDTATTAAHADKAFFACIRVPPRRLGHPRRTKRNYYNSGLRPK